MKKIIQLTSLIILVIFILTACVNDTDFKIPIPPIQNEPDLTGHQKTTFRALVAAYEQALVNESTFILFEEDIYIEGYVISNDQAGNFFEELIIQNHPDDQNPIENPRLGFKISINVSNLYQSYEFGRKIYVKMKGLTVSIENGVYVIAKGASGTANQIQSYEYRNIILRSPEKASIIPKTTTISELTEVDENTYVQIPHVQFKQNNMGLSYAGEPNDEFDGFRTIESCQERATIDLETSTFADFKSLTVNNNQGTISAIVSRDFRDNKNVLKINSTANILFDKPNRCDPIALNCGLAPEEGTLFLFNDMFETQTTSSPITGNGWTNFQETGTVTWKAYTATGANATQGIAAKIGSFRSGDNSTIAWLITPKIDLEAHTRVTLSFETSTSFADDSVLELLFSNNWDGTEAGILTATWGVLPAAYIAKNTDSFASWFNSGIVDLSCGTGTIHIAFRYTGSGYANSDGTYELDNIKITAQ